MPKPPKAIVSVSNDLFTDQRVHKVCMFLWEQGYDVLLVGRKRRNSKALLPRDYPTKRVRLLFESGPLFYAALNFRLFFLLLFRKADVLVANDLDTLLANYLVKKVKPRTRLVYDSHEFFTEVPELLNRPRVRGIWLAIEKWIFPKLQVVYTVNESIAAEYRKRYQKEVLVLRNISPRWNPKVVLSREELGIPLRKHLLIIQGAGINVDRGAEEAVEAMRQIDAVLLIVGDGDVVPYLKERVISLELTDKVLFFDKQPYERMMNFTYHADLGLTLDKPTNANYILSLPNKVFDYIQAGTPIVSTKIREISALVDKHQVGVIIEELSPNALAETINALLNDTSRLELYKKNCLAAAETENWENERQVLKQIYPKYES